MTVRGIQLRAILIPVSVALFSVAALAWYGLVYIPSQQRYLNERNIRLLRTVVAQIRSKVNNFDQAIDNAVDSFSIGDKPINSQKATDLEKFSKYVKGFSPTLEVLDKAAEDEQLRKATNPADLFDDPPRVKIVPDEGTHYLYLFYRHLVQRDSTATEVRLSARADIEKAVSADLSSRTEFDTVALVDSEGRVIAQSKSGVRLWTLDSITGATITQAPAAKGLEALRANGNMADVTIAGTGYKLYVQPVDLSLLSQDGKKPEEWAVCGLVRLDDFRGASSAISYSYWLMLIAALGVLCLAIPLLKLHVLSPRERFHRSDGVLVAVTTFLLAALLTLGVLDLQYFGRTFRNSIDQQLVVLADGIAGQLTKELEAVRQETDQRVDVVEKEVYATKEFETWSSGEKRQTHIIFKNDEVACEPEWACKTSLIGIHKIDPEQAPYPYFDLVAWSDQNGEQRIKWTTKKAITPFINITDLPYNNDLDRVVRLGGTAPHVPQRGISVLESPNTGNPLTVLWTALGTKEPRAVAVSMAMATPLSVGNPVLPQWMQFAVIDASGMVMFHSDSTRNLKENFFTECGDSPTLRGLVLGRRRGALTTEYLGLQRRFFVRPIELEGGLKEPQWSLLVFQDMLVSETVNLETLTLAAALFLSYALLLGSGAALVHLVWPQHTSKWFWPDHLKGRRYLCAGLLNVILSLSFLIIIARANPAALLLETMLLSVGAAVATFAIIRFSDLSAAPWHRWQQYFLFARVSFLFVIAAVPAIACFQVAYHFESSLLTRRGEGYLADALSKRVERVDNEIALLGLCSNVKKCWEDQSVGTFRTRRLKETWDIHTIPFAAFPPARPTPQTDWLDRTLGRAHIGYNHAATDLENAFPEAQKEETAYPQGASSTPLAPVIEPDLWFWFIAGMSALGLTLLARFAVRPLFLMHLYVPPGVKPCDNRDLTGNLLMVGPPGSGKTRALRKDSISTVFDVRTLAYSANPCNERVREAPDLQADKVAAASASRSESTELPMLAEDGIVGIDHLEYRFDDATVRARILTLLEDLLYRRRYRVWIASNRDPINQLEESGAQVDIDRWRRLLQSFRLETVGLTGLADPEAAAEISKLLWKRTGTKCSPLERLVLDECSFVPSLVLIAKGVIERLPADIGSTPENVLFEIGEAAEPFYRAIWSACSKDQKLALLQLAEEGVVNPSNTRVIAQLLRSGLVRRDPTFRIMNTTFRRFVARETQSDALVAWEHEGVQVPWSSIATTMITVAIALSGLLLLTWQQLADAWIGYVPALAPAVPTILKLFTSIQASAKSEGAAA